MPGMSDMNDTAGSKTRDAIAHDLSNLLLAISLNLESLAAECPPTPAAETLVDGMRQAIEEARRLVDRFCAAARPEPASAAGAVPAALARRRLQGGI
jgi:signal transduction histidine kinase